MTGLPLGLLALSLAAVPPGETRSKREQAAGSQPTPRSSGAAPEQGWYTHEQAERGSASYLRHCAECHGADFVPDDFSPGLAGAAFDWDWEGRTVDQLFQAIRDTMPPAREGTLSAAECVDIVAYLLEVNGFPAGSRDLRADPDLTRELRMTRGIR